MQYETLNNKSPFRGYVKYDMNNKLQTIHTYNQTQERQAEITVMMVQKEKLKNVSFL